MEAIYNESGQVQARYVYDAWGKVKSVLDANNNQITDTNHIGHINPIRYRGYYYDTETSFYYLQSRYYDPEVGRFINGDFQLNSDILGSNLYIYCGNNPVNYEDDEGTSWTALIALKVAFDMVCDIVVTSAIKESTGEEYTALDLCSSVVSSIILGPMDDYWKAGKIAVTLECVFGILQGENVSNVALNATSAFLGTSITVNNMADYSKFCKFDDLSKTINDLTYGSVEYLLLTLAEEGISNAMNRHSINNSSHSSKPLHEIVNFKKIPTPSNKKTGYGFCPR